jgi:hypothetical protein
LPQSSGLATSGNAPLVPLKSRAFDWRQALRKCEEIATLSVKSGQYSPGQIVKKKVYKRRVQEDSQ